MPWTSSRLALAIALTVLVSLPLAATMWALLDAARRPQWAWALAGRSQVIWMAWILFASLTLSSGIFVSGLVPVQGPPAHRRGRGGSPRTRALASRAR